MNEEHPFEVACKLARALEEMRECQRLKACIAAVNLLTPQAPVVEVKPTEDFRGDSVMKQIYGAFNGAPLHMAELRKQRSDLSEFQIRNACNNLIAKGLLRRTYRNTWQRTNIHNKHE